MVRAWQQTNNTWPCLLLVLDMHKQEPTRSLRSCLSALLRKAFRCASCTMRSMRCSTNSSLASVKPLACAAIALRRQKQKKITSFGQPTSLINIHHWAQGCRETGNLKQSRTSSQYLITQPEQNVAQGAAQECKYEIVISSLTTTVLPWTHLSTLPPDSPPPPPGCDPS